MTMYANLAVPLLAAFGAFLCASSQETWSVCPFRINDSGFADDVVGGLAVMLGAARRPGGWDLQLAGTR
jgi:hypothetical protein